MIKCTEEKIHVISLFLFHMQAHLVVRWAKCTEIKVYCCGFMKPFFFPFLHKASSIYKENVINRWFISQFGIVTIWITLDTFRNLPFLCWRCETNLGIPSKSPMTCGVHWDHHTLKQTMKDVKNLWIIATSALKGFTNLNSWHPKLLEMNKPPENI